RPPQGALRGLPRHLRGGGGRRSPPPGGRRLGSQLRDAPRDHGEAHRRALPAAHPAPRRVQQMRSHPALAGRAARLRARRGDDQRARQALAGDPRGADRPEAHRGGAPQPGFFVVGGGGGGALRAAATGGGGGALGAAAIGGGGGALGAVATGGGAGALGGGGGKTTSGSEAGDGSKSSRLARASFTSASRSRPPSSSRSMSMSIA